MLRCDSPSLCSQRCFHLAGPLAEMTADPRFFCEIPGFLQRALHLVGVSFGLVRVEGVGAPVVVSLYTATRCSNAETVDSALARRVVEVATGGELLLHEGPCRCQYQVVRRGVGEGHRLVLLAHCPLAAQSLELLQLVADYLAGALATTLSWRGAPRVLGEPFARLTDREWAVLCGLRTEDGEKQLADQLGLSPHTLHSHVKAIYRKLGVQGRLPLRDYLDGALRAYRARVAVAAQEGLDAEGVEARKAG